MPQSEPNVIYFEDYQQMAQLAKDTIALAVGTVVPKTTSHSYAGHRYVLRFDPNASVRNRWHWTVRFTKTYEFTGTAMTINAAARKAQRQIDALTEYTSGLA